jgi:hypothetical protein
MTTVARPIHRLLDRQFAEAMARDDRHDQDRELDLTRPIRTRRKDFVMDRPQPFQVAKLWSRVSQRTNRPYLVGRWGGARVLVFDNHERKSEDEPSHFLLLAQADDKPRDGDRS